MNRLCRFYDIGFPKEGRGGDEQAAIAVAAWLQRADRIKKDGRCPTPSLDNERKTASRHLLAMTNPDARGMDFPPSIRKPKGRKAI